MLNMAQILGRVGKIDTKTTAAGLKITNCSIVTSKKYKKEGEQKEKITWHNISLFNKLAEIAEKYVAVGDLLYIQGELDNQKYTEQNGNERTRSCIIAHDLKLMPKSKQLATAPKDDAYGAGTEDDVPW